MAYFSRRSERERLERGVEGKEYVELLNRAADAARFSTWREVLSFMHTSESNPAKNEILKAIFSEHKKDQDPRWRVLLLLIFWPAIESIHWKKRRWDTDPEERWQNIIWVFLRIVCRIDVAVRPDRLAQKVVNDTIHHLWDEYRSARRRVEREIAMSDEEFDEHGFGQDEIDYNGIDLALQKERYIESLRSHMDNGKIDEEDYLLLIGTRVYGKALSDCAIETGISYHAAKKRRQRAEAAIRKTEGILKREKHLSPQTE